MIFKVLNARSNNSEIVVSGVLKGATEDEKELLTIINDEFKKIKTYNDRVSVKNKQLIFKGVPNALLKQTLNYLAYTLDFDLSYEIGKEFTGDKKIKALLEKSFQD